MSRDFYLGLATGALGALAGLGLAWRPLTDKAIDLAIHQIMTRPYDRNLWELFYALQRVSPQVVVETALRAEHGKIIDRPFSGPRRFTELDQLMFNVAQLHASATPLHDPVDLSVTLGPRATKPLRLRIPILVSGMAYGLALSDRAQMAIARGTALAGTASNTGEGPLLPAKRQLAKHLILQYNRSTWSKDLATLRQADMIEIQFGQGAWGGTGHITPASEIDPALRRQLGLAPGQDAVANHRPIGAANPAALRRLVEYLRRVTGGVPIGIKLATGHSLERDLQVAVEAGVDVISLDGAQAATKGSPPILQDDFGIPTFYALCRAGRFFEQHHLKNRVSLLMAGGLTTPGEFLKTIALGADAVYIGTIALFALSHTQALKSLPFEPPTQLVFHHGQTAKKLKINEAAQHLANYLNSCALEMSEGIKALGKTSLAQVNRNDLVALDPLVAQTARVPLATGG